MPESGEELRYSIERATADDLPAILEVMRHYNMHEVPGAEKAEPLVPGLFFVARLENGEIAGAAGWMLEGPGRGRTTLLAVNPAYGGQGIGHALQSARLRVMRKAGVELVTTNTDRQDSVNWYIKHFGYRNTGRTKPKKAAFGAAVDHWTTLELELTAWQDGSSTDATR